MATTKTHNLTLTAIIGAEDLSVKIEEICTLLENNEKVVIDLQGKRFTANELLRTVRFVAEVEEYISFIADGNYKEHGECLVGDMVFRNGEDTVTF